MELKVYSVFDKKAGAFGQPFFCRSPGEAERSLRSEVMRRESPISMFPQDFALFYIGTWNDANGRLVPLEHGATEVVSALELMPSSDAASG